MNVRIYTIEIQRLSHHNALVGVEFEPVSDEEQRRIRAGFIEMRVRRNRLQYMYNDRASRRNRLEQRALIRRLNRKQFGKTILIGILIGES